MTVQDETPTLQSEPPAKSQDAELRQGQVLFIVILIALVVVVAWWTALHLERKLLTDNETNVIRWVAPFNKPPWQWVDWMLTALAGALLYALSNVAAWYHRAKPRFIRFTPWYVSTILKGPLVALIILLFLTSVDVDIAGLSLDFTNLGVNVLLVAAFVLGFYNRVAREQLNLIVKALFGKAYGRAEEVFGIVPGNVQLVFGQSQQFKTEPVTPVTWLASAGNIVDGLYTAPKTPDAKPGQEVQITAVPEDANIPRAVAKVILRPFEIQGRTNIAYEAKEKYQATTQEPVNWSVSPVLPGAEMKADGEFHAPPKGKAGEIKKVTITATNRKDPAQLATLEVFIKEL